MKAISSPANPLVKRVRKIARTPGRDRERFVVEGVKLVKEALAASLAIEEAVLSRGFVDGARGREVLSRLEARGIPSTVLGEKLFESLSTLETPEGVLLLARRPALPLAAVTGDLVVVAAGVQDPGNLGAIARVAEAVGASGLVLCEGTADPFQPKSVRGAMGSLFRVPVWQGGAPDAVHAVLKQKNYRTVGTVPKDGIAFQEANLTPPFALFLGNEGHGLPPSIEGAVDLRVRVPMRAPVESLNVAVVAGLLLYEATRKNLAS